MRITAKRIISHQTSDIREQTFVKFWLDTYMAQVFQDSERPVRESWNISNLFTGWCKRFVARAIAKRDMSFIYSLNKGSKQMWGPLSEENVRKSIIKSKDRLCNFRGTLPEDICITIDRVARSIFQEPDSVVDFGLRFMPSGSACLQASVKDGGALSTFEPLVHITSDPLRYCAVCHSRITKTNSCLCSRDSKLADFERIRVGSLVELNLSVNSWRQVTFDTALKRVQTGRYETDEDYQIPMFDVKYFPIYEPGKIRNISIMDGNLATVLQPLQGCMLSSWKRQFWSTMLEDDLLPSVRLMDQNVKEEFWCSGDYEAATDLLLRDATIACFNALSWHPLFGIGYDSLILGRMIYPDLKTLRYTDSVGNFIGEKLPMFEGQLMGHVLSFPMLCVINLAVLRHSIDVWVKTPISKNLPTVRNVMEYNDRKRRGELIYRYAKVNGDDILFKCSRELFEIFKLTSKKVGFKISQGKNFLSLDSCVINSQVYHRVGGVMQRFGYLNLRLVKGSNIKARLATHEKPITPSQISGELSKMAFNCPWSSSAIPTAFNRWKKDWKDFSWFKPNWYLPVHLGGYGLDINLAPSTFKITRAQRIVAAMFLANPEMALYRLKSQSINSAKYANAVLHPRIIPGSYVPNKHEVLLMESDDSWLARIAYAARAENGSKQFLLEGETPIIIGRFRRQFRLSPISSDGLLLYWRAQFFTVGAPICPPIGYIKFPEDLV